MLMSCGLVLMLTDRQKQGNTAAQQAAASPPCQACTTLPILRAWIGEHKQVAVLELIH